VIEATESSEGASEERNSLGGAVVVRVAALLCEALRLAVDCKGVAGVRVDPSQAGRVTRTFMECPSSDVAGGRRTDDAELSLLVGLPCDELETKREPNLEFAEDSQEYPGDMIGPRRGPSPPGPGRCLVMGF
jgi:hypothetical protein